MNSQTGRKTVHKSQSPGMAKTMMGKCSRALRDSRPSLIPRTKFDPIPVSLAGLEISKSENKLNQLIPVEQDNICCSSVLDIPYFQSRMLEHCTKITQRNTNRTASH